MKNLENKIEFICNKKVKFGCSKAQFNYMCSLENIEVNVAMNRAFNFISSKQASELIESAKKGVLIEINA